MGNVDAEDEIRKDLRELRKEVRAVREQVEGLNGTDDTGLLPRDDAADRLGISTRTLDTLEAAGEIQAVRIRGRVLYHPDTIDAFIRRAARGDRS
jgi:excisionase family DNA binding protein